MVVLKHKNTELVERYVGDYYRNLIVRTASIDDAWIFTSEEEASLELCTADDWGQYEFVSVDSPDKSIPIITEQERKVITTLGEAYNEFCKLPYRTDVTPDDATDFRQAIHQAQRIVSARITARQFPDFFNRKEPLEAEN